MTNSMIVPWLAVVTMVASLNGSHAQTLMPDQLGPSTLAAAIRRLDIQGEAFDGGSITLLDAAVATVLLKSIRGELPQWAVVDQVEEINLEPTGTYSAFRIER